MVKDIYRMLLLRSEPVYAIACELNRKKASNTTGYSKWTTKLYTAYSHIRSTRTVTFSVGPLQTLHSNRETTQIEWIFYAWTFEPSSTQRPRRAQKILTSAPSTRRMKNIGRLTRPARFGTQTYSHLIKKLSDCPSPSAFRGPIRYLRGLTTSLDTVVRSIWFHRHEPSYQELARRTHG